MGSPPVWVRPLFLGVCKHLVARLLQMRPRLGLPVEAFGNVS